VKKLSPKERARIKARNGRIRRGVMWGLLACAVCIVLMAAASYWRSFGLVWGTGDAQRQRVSTLEVNGWRFQITSQVVKGAGTPPPGLHSRMTPARTSLWMPAAGSIAGRTRASLMFFHLLIPLGIAFLVLASYEDQARRNARRGCCRACGYNLKGLEPVDFRTTCPECGAVKRHRRPKKPAVAESPEPVVATGS
jgi:hypothetical protein